LISLVRIVFFSEDFFFLHESIQICGYRSLRVSHSMKCICATFTYIREECAARRYLASRSISAMSPLSFLNLPVQLNFTLWYSTIDHCARLVTQIILSLSKYGLRIVSTAQPGTKYPYLPPVVSNREESTFSKLDPLCSKISRFSWNDLSPLLRTALVIASGAPLVFRRTRSCVLLCTSFYPINIQNVLFSSILPFIPVLAVKKI